MGSISHPKKWLITGASQGLGFAMAMSALQAGHKVLAGARNPSKAASDHPELEGAGGKWFQLDVAVPEAQDVVSKTVEEAGGIDVVVNNAGAFPAGSIEDVTEEEMQSATSLNFFGPIRVLKGALPSMRAQKSGTIVLNSSIFGFYPCPGGAMYNTTKAAGDILYDTLKVEVAPLNIRVVTLNLGMFQTNVLLNAPMPSGGFKQEYLEKSAIGGVLGYVGAFAQDPDKHIPGDPAKFGDRVVEIVDGTGFGESLMKVNHVFIGKDSLSLARKKLDMLQADLEASQKIGSSTDLEGTSALGVAVVADL